MNVTTDIYIDGVKLPPADKSGIAITPQTIWSSNAGRISTTGKFVGDIKTIKYTVTYNLSRATAEEFDIIDSVVNNMTSIHKVRMFIPGFGTEVTKNFYIGSGTFAYTIQKYDNGEPIYEGISFQMIEQ